MSISQYIFWFLSFVAVLSALIVVFAKNPIYSVLNLIITFFAIAGHYFLLNAQFLAAVHIIVYAGAIMVLFLYVIMMLNLNKETEPHKKQYVKLVAVVAAGLLMLTIIGSLKGAEAMVPAGIVNNNIGTVELIGDKLFGEFLLPFEVSSILLLSAMVGAVYLSKKELH
ncbi:MAG: NADH-quinone oxidoreductase subunit J [Bacteroidetes bacterium]|nr:NADH-quinone oxidoreductase subunit J [Bacteroidota bacterium]